MVVLRMDIQDEILYGDCDLDRFKYVFLRIFNGGFKNGYSMMEYYLTTHCFFLSYIFFFVKSKI